MAGFWYMMGNLWPGVSVSHMPPALREGCSSRSWGLSCLWLQERALPSHVLSLTVLSGFCWMHVS